MVCAYMLEKKKKKEKTPTPYIFACCYDGNNKVS